VFLKEGDQHSCGFRSMGRSAGCSVVLTVRAFRFRISSAFDADDGGLSLTLAVLDSL
jgi:hypothetical protein